MMRLIYPLVLLSTAFKLGAVATQAVFSSKQIQYGNCGWPNDTAKIESIKISPDPPEAGKEAVITAKIETFVDIEEGAYAVVTTKTSPISVPEGNAYDLCDLWRDSQENICRPIKAGSHTFIQTIAVPKNITPALYEFSMRAYTVEGTPMFCPNIYVDFRP
ncbi:hypothetical protein BC629DRAFT_1461259 [Irpex lacteus]|nr:hypothetical protein BC629DRAFT_1461259 [Irpex lacteus]